MAQHPLKDFDKGVTTHPSSTHHTLGQVTTILYNNMQWPGPHPPGVGRQDNTQVGHTSTIVQLGLKLNTKLGLDHHPPTTHNKLFLGF